MSYPVLYPADEVNFENNGLGIIADCLSCVVTEEANGEFELTMTYPESGKRAALFELDGIIKAKPNRTSNPQLFRIYAISKPMNDRITINAQHISYDLSGVPALPFVAQTAMQALNFLADGALIYSPFSFWTDITDEAELVVPVPTSSRAIIGAEKDSILSVFGGQLEFDNFIVKLHKSRGSDKGFVVRYGKNLKSLKQDENCANVITGICPYFIDKDTEEIMMLSDPIIFAPGIFSRDKVVPVDFSGEFDQKPTEDELTAVAVEYVLANGIGVPDVSLNVSYFQTDLDDVGLFDTVTVIFPRSKINTKAVVNKVVYNVLVDRVDSVSLGTVSVNIADTIAGQQKSIAEKPDQNQLKTVVSQSVSAATVSKLKSIKEDKTMSIENAALSLLVGVGTAFSVSVSDDGLLILNVGGVAKKPSWKDNGDGTSTLIGY